MILFLEYSAGGQRGGEQFTRHLHSLIRSRFSRVEPAEIPLRPRELGDIIMHARISLRNVKSLKPALVVIDISSGARNILAARWVKRHGGKVMIIVQGTRQTYRFNNIFARKFVLGCENHLLGLADIVFSNSQYIADYARSRSARLARIIICHPGVDIPIENSKSEKGSDHFLEMLAVGECTEPRKGIKYLLEALAHLSDIPIKLHLAGGYSMESHHYKVLRNILEDHHLNENVIFHGFLDRENLNRLYRKSDIFVMPSLSEGYGLALAEALSFGLPIVASNVAAIPEMISDGVNGFLVSPKNPQELASAIRKMASDSALRLRFRHDNLEQARRLPTWSDFEAKLDSELVPAIEQITGMKKKDL